MILKTEHSINTFFILLCSKINHMKNKKNPKNFQTKIKKQNQELGPTKNSAKLVLFIFGLGPIIGIIIFLFSKGFFNAPNL